MAHNKRHSTSGMVRVRLLAGRFLRACAYMLLASEWLLLFAAFLPSLLDSPVGEFVAPTETSQATRPEPAGLDSPDWMLAIFATAIALLLVGGVVYAIYYYTRTTVKAVQQSTEAAASVVIPKLEHVVFHHRKPTAPKKRRLTALVQRWMFVCGALLPIAPLAILRHYQDSVSYDLVFGLAAFLACLSLVLFAFAQLLVKGTSGQKKSAV